VQIIGDKVQSLAPDRQVQSSLAKILFSTKAKASSFSNFQDIPDKVFF
jgi:hypothetical protein